MHARNKLSSKSIEHEKEPGRYADGGGLYLQVSKSDGGVTKSWLFRYMLNGAARQMGLGPIDVVPLKDAREKALKCRRSLLDGVDPIDTRREQRMRGRAEAAKSVTFEECADRYIAAHAAGWRNEKHGAQWKATLATYAYPVVGKLSVAAIDTAHVMRILEPIWSEKTETAGRVRGRIESVLDWAGARKYRHGENPARWKGHLDKLLPARHKVRRVKHHAALPYGEIADFVAGLRDREGNGARALEFTILTAVRTGEAIRATWAEFDFSAKTWTIPGERTKSGREHKVPLCDRAISIVKALPREAGCEFVFIGDVAGQHLSNMTMLAQLARMGRSDLTVHGFRSTFRDWAAECTNYPNHVVEMALGHVVGDKVEAAYRRGDLFAKRQRLMREWERYCATQSATDKGNIVGIGAADSGAVP
jgi:integrase